VKLSDRTGQHGIYPGTLQRWFEPGSPAVPARRLPSCTVVVEGRSPQAGKVARFAPVASHDQRSDLDRPRGWWEESASHDSAADMTVAEVGSGMNGARPKRLRLLADGRVGTIVAEHRKRSARLASEHIESALRARHAGTPTAPLPSAITGHKEWNSGSPERNRRAVPSSCWTVDPSRGWASGPVATSSS